MALVRVQLPDGTQVSVGEGTAKTHNLKVLDKPAERFGRAIPAKPKTSVAKSTESKSTSNPAGSGSSASSKEESK